MAWGLVVAQAFTPPVLAAFILIAALLLIGCGYCIVKGRALKKRHPFPRGPWNKGFLIVTALEAIGVVSVIFVAQKLARLEMLPDWIGLVIGLHFFALAKVFRAPRYYFTGTAITLWCLLCWALFRNNALAVAVGVGVGTILWATSFFNLLRVLARSTQSKH